jgi:hypothetical protein
LNGITPAAQAWAKPVLFFEMTQITENPEAIVERVRQEVARRKGLCPTAPAATVSKKKSIFQKAFGALDRAKNKQLRAREWPRLLRPMRRDQEVINDALISALQGLLKEAERIAQTTVPLTVQLSTLATRVQQQQEMQRVLADRVKALERRVAELESQTSQQPKS